jgi:hypothetical protein
MLRNFFLSLLLICLGAWCAFTVGCGGSSKSTTTSCTGSYTVVGDWEGTFNGSGGQTAANGVINSSGAAAFFDSDADIAVLPTISGACSFAGTETIYSSTESEGGVETESGTATGNVTSDSAINGSESIDGSTGTFNLTSYSPVSSVTALSGGTFGYAIGQPEQDEITLTLGGTSSSITFSGTDVFGCSISGTFTEESTNNVYDVTYDVSSTSSCTGPGNLTGIGFESTSDLLDVDGGESGTYAYAIITSSAGPFVLEIVPSSDSSDHRNHQRKNAASFHNLFGFTPHFAK